MEQFVTDYLAWGGPNVVSALVTGTLVWWLHHWRLTGEKWPRDPMPMAMATGGGVLGVVIISVLAAIFRIEPIGGGLLGVVLGVISGTLGHHKKA